MHAFWEGTDAGEWWFIATAVIAIVPVATLLGLRLAGRTRSPGAPRAAHGQAA